MKTHDQPPTNCPACHHRIDAASNATPSERAPKVGQHTICAYCAAPLVFGEGLTLRRATRADAAALSPESRELLRGIQAGIVELIHERKEKA